jgi:hypothetical protein
MPNLHHQYKSAERKISLKNPEYTLQGFNNKHSLTCYTKEETMNLTNKGLHCFVPI